MERVVNVYLVNGNRTKVADLSGVKVFSFERQLSRTVRSWSNLPNRGLDGVTMNKCEALLRTKSEGQVCALGSNANSVEEEVASVAADLYKLGSTLMRFFKQTSVLRTGLSGFWYPTASEMWGISGWWSGSRLSSRAWGF